jgi:predicted N-acyltransferase
VGSVEVTRPKVAIYNLYWATYGGGEQVSGAIAETLSKYCDVTLLGPEEPNIDATRARLGVDLGGCAWRKVVDDLEAGVASADFDVFINGTYRSHTVNQAPVGLYYVHFPEPPTTSRRKAIDAAARSALIAALKEVQEKNDLSSTHILYPPEQEAKLLEDAGFMLRKGVQFHWKNQGFENFEQFLSTLEQKKRKNIRAERRKVHEAGITLRQLPGVEASEADWRFFKRCYDHTYSAHYSTPYLNLDFFLRISQTMPENILLVIAEREGNPIASSLLIHDKNTLYGRYWGALEHHACLHFETAYYQPLEFCIANKIAAFEGGAQGEHKMARGFLPQQTWSAHWLAHPGFADAVERFLDEEGKGIENYVDELNERNPFKS